MLRLLADQQQLARGCLPQDVYDYYASGSGDEVAVREAEAAWLDFRFRPRVLRDVSTVDPGVELFGATLNSPLGVAPMAFHRLAHPDGEVETVRGAGAAGALTVISTRASRTLEDIASAATAPWWFQIYVMRDRDLTRALVERAAVAGAGAIVLTGDTPYVGLKQRVSGVRFAVPQAEFLVNLARHLPPGADTAAAAAQDPSVNPNAIAWLGEVSGLPVLVKGVLRGDDARRCIDAGAAGLVVSNHGGRQLSRALPSAHALTEVAAAVAGRVPILVDGGVRCGVDAAVALALGADAVLLGRPVLWALAADGASGVCAALRAVQDDLAHALALLGCCTLAELDSSVLTRVARAIPVASESTDA